MPMRRDQPLPDLTPRSVLRSQSAPRLKLVLRRALRAAFASTLIAAGCSDSHTDHDANVAGRRTDVAGSGAGVAGRVANAAGRGSDAAGRGSDVAGSGGRLVPPTNPGGGSPSVPTCRGKTRLAVEDLDPAQHVDYVAELVAFDSVGPAQIISDVGARCDTPNPECAEDLDVAQQPNDLTFTQDCGQRGFCRYFFVATDGDQVKRYTNRDELLQFLGGIDTPQEAFLLVEYDGYVVSCPANESPGFIATASAIAGKDGFEVTVMQTTNICPVQMDKVGLTVTREGVVTEISRQKLKALNECSGRRPEGWVAQGRASSNDTLADHFASMASLEAASVTAFEVLAAELTHYGAPLDLIERMHAAAREEIVHARETTALARLLGAEPELPQIEARPIRTLEEIALDNAIEGCVRETFGAAVGCYQADQARDTRIAELMHQLAADEIGHAALAFDLHLWLMPKLSTAGRARVIAAHVAAIDDLSLELEVEPPRVLRELAGLPGRREAARLFDTLRRELWFADEILA